MPAMSSAAVQDQIASGQVKRAGSPTGTNTKGVSTKGSTDLSSGDLTSILNLANQSEAHIADAYNQGAQAQAAIDAGAVTSSSTTSGGLSGLLSQPYTKWIIAAGVVIGGYVIYQRRKSGTPTFPNSGGGNDASF
jgi:hypothetical protein